jgi:hypothetical protein
MATAAVSSSKSSTSTTGTPLLDGFYQRFSKSLSGGASEYGRQYTEIDSKYRSLDARNRKQREVPSQPMMMLHS